MFPSLILPKQRVVVSDQCLFYNDFNNTLHAEFGGVSDALALNLGQSNWTVSPCGEVGYLLSREDNQYIVIDNPEKKTRLIQKWTGPSVLNLLLTENDFFVAIPGYLIKGKREKNGALSTKGMRALDCGAQFFYRLEDDERLSYTKRGSSLRYYIYPNGKKHTEVDYPTLWRIAFFDCFTDGFLPNMPSDFQGNFDDLRFAFFEAAKTHPISPSGTRLCAILHLPQFSKAGALEFEKLLNIDWFTQYTNSKNDYFPSPLLFNRLFHVDNIDELVPAKVIAVKMQKWSRIHEDPNAIGTRAKPLSVVGYKQIEIEGGSK